MKKEPEIPLSPLMARFKKAGLLGCFDGTGVNSQNYKEILNGSPRKKKDGKNNS